MFFRGNSIYFATEAATYEWEHECSLKTRYEVQQNCDKIELFAANRPCSYFVISIVHVAPQKTKQLVVLNDNWVPIRNLNLNRAANWIGFLTDDIVLFVDKNGEVFRFEIVTEALVKLFGHCSLIVDLAISPCQKYVATGDRDEKIRVSHYPNTFDIESYCLGHRKFVSKLAFYLNGILISSSGDGYLKFWDYVNGVELRGALLQTKNDPILNFELCSNFILIETRSKNKKSLNLYEIQNQKSNLEVVFFQSLPIKDILIYKWNPIHNRIVIISNSELYWYQYNNLNGQFEINQKFHFNGHFQLLIGSRVYFDFEILMKKSFNCQDDCVGGNKKLKTYV